MVSFLKSTNLRSLLQDIANIAWLHLPLFGSLLIIQFINVGIYYHFTEHVGIIQCLGSIAWAYIQIIPTGFIRSKRWLGVYSLVILIINSLLGLIQLFCAIQFEELVYSTHIMLMTNTNPEEASEFFATFVDYKITILIAVIALLAVAIYHMMRQIRRCVRSMFIAHILTALSMISLLSTTYFGLWWECGIGRAANAIISVNKFKSYDLKESQSQFDVVERSLLHPNIILIIGESFDKNHSNMYGYEKRTNPLLTKRLEDSTMVLFNSVQSPAPITNLAIRQMLSLSDFCEDESWHKKAMLPTALAKCGYSTRWISNQTANSVFDNILGQFAELCDSAFYTSKQYMADKTRYDEVLFSPFLHYTSNVGNSEQHFCVIHLMGSHNAYNLRYPKKYSIFTAADYDRQPINRRSTFAEYDNSILYNDYVVDSLFSIANRLEAIVIYISDHGQDFYYTRDCATHGRMNDTESFKAGCQIPFMIYLTDSFRAKHPEAVGWIKQQENADFNSKYLMNTIMDMVGYDICDSTIYANSLFQGKFSGGQDVLGTKDYPQ